jgi:nitrate reductase delta subunit
MMAQIRTFKALSALLTYPSEELQAVAGDIGEAIRVEGLADPAACEAMTPLIEALAFSDLFDLQERYVDLFDKTRRLSLNLFEHVHGESRDRGQAMVDLAALYEQGGFMLATNELPDHLPVFLEYLSTRSLGEARALLSDVAHLLGLLEERLRQRDAGYAAVLAALCSIAGKGTVPAEVHHPAEGEADDLAALDAAWEETAVVFGPGDALDGCSTDRLRIQMRAGRRDVRRATA